MSYANKCENACVLVHVQTIHHITDNWLQFNNSSQNHSFTDSYGRYLQSFSGLTGELSLTPCEDVDWEDQGLGLSQGAAVCGDRTQVSRSIQNWNGTHYVVVAQLMLKQPIDVVIAQVGYTTGFDHRRSVSVTIDKPIVWLGGATSVPAAVVKPAPCDPGTFRNASSVCDLCDPGAADCTP